MKIHEIDRRGFLKGLGAAAAASAAGSAISAPFSHGSFKDPMTGEGGGKYSNIKSDNSNATLEIQWPGTKQPGFIITIPRTVINMGVRGTSGRIKIGGKVETIFLNPMSSNDPSSAGVLDAAIARKILTTPGELLIEVPIYREGNQIYKFTVEPDSVSKSSPGTDKQQVKKDEPNDVQGVRQSNLDRMSGQSSAPSASYAGRLRGRIKPNITFADEVVGNPKAEVEVRVASDGTILGRRLLSSSGNNAWDTAVLKAIDKTEIFPRDTDGRVPPSIIISFRPKD